MWAKASRRDCECRCSFNEADDFEAALAKNDVNFAWRLLSDVAEAAFALSVTGLDWPRSSAWDELVHGPHAARMPAFVELRRLRRLHRRLLQLQASPDDSQLRRRLVRRFDGHHSMHPHPAWPYSPKSEQLHVPPCLRRPVQRCHKRHVVSSSSQLPVECENCFMLERIPNTCTCGTQPCPDL